MSRGVTIEGGGRRRSSGLLLVSILALAGCRDGRPAEPVTTISAPLTVGAAELALAPAAQENGGETTSTPRVACNASGRCLVVWVQSFAAANYVFARRMDQNNPVDAQVIVLGASSTPTSTIVVGARDAGDFMAAWWSAAAGAISLARVDAATGAVLDSPPRQIADNVRSLDRILVVNDGYVVIYGSAPPSSEPIWRAARVQGGTVVDAPGISLGVVGASLAVTNFAAGPGQQIAVVSPAGLVRVDLATGTILDAAPIAYSRWAVGDGRDDVGVAFDGANYILIWSFSGRTYAIRVRASDGAILDPHDDLNQTTGAHVVATSDVPPDILTAVFDGTNVILFASINRSGARSLVVTRVSTSATRVQGAPDATAYEALIGYGIGGMPDADLAYRAGVGIITMTAGTNGVIGYRLTGAAGEAPTAILGYFSISYSGVTQDLAAVASNGRDFLFVHRTTATSQSSPAIMATVIDGQTGAVVGTPVFIGSTSSTSPAVAAVWTGRVYLVAFAGTGLTLRALSCTGQPLGPGESLGGVSNRNIDMACNADRCAVAYVASATAGVVVRRLDPLDGTVLDAAPITIQAGATSGGPAIAADSDPATAMRTFLVVFASESEIRARRFRSDTGMVTSATTITTDALTSSGFRASSDGRQFFVSWTDGGRARGTLVEALTGVPTLAAPVDLGPGAAITSATFDGSSFVSFWSTATELRGGRVTPAGGVLDGEGFVINTLPSESVTAAGSAAFGRSLAAFRMGEVRSVSSVFRGRFVDNEHGPGLAGRAPACAAATGTGGAGGAGGAGGGGAGGAAGTGGAGAGGATGGATAAGGSTGTGGSASGGATGASGSLGGAGSTGSAGSSGGAGSGAGQAGRGGSGAAGAGLTNRGDDGCGCDTSGRGSAPLASLVPLAILIVSRRRRK
jgi:hypothetical protein